MTDFFEVPAKATTRSFSQGVEVIANALLPVVENMPGFVSRNLYQILLEQGIPKDQLKNDAWLGLDTVLNFYKKVKEQYGPHTVFDIGKTIPKVAEFPPNIENIHQALETLNDAYYINHRNGYVGFYHLVSHDYKTRTCMMQMYTPYDDELNKGLLMGLGRRFAGGVRVEPTEGKPSAERGGYESWFTLTYR